MSSSQRPDPRPEDRSDDRVDAGRRPGMHPEAQRSGIAPGTWIAVGIPIVALIVFLLVTTGIVGN